MLSTSEALSGTEPRLNQRHGEGGQGRDGGCLLGRSVIREAINDVTATRHGEHLCDVVVCLWLSKHGSGGGLKVSFIKPPPTEPKHSSPSHVVLYMFMNS